MYSNNNVRYEIQEILRQASMTNYSQAIINMGIIIEDILENLYRTIIPELSGKEKEKIAKYEPSSNSPLKGHTLGRWIKYFINASLPGYLKKYNVIEDTFFDKTFFDKLIEIRNKCTHDKYKATKEDYSEIFEGFSRFLTNSSYIDEIPKHFDSKTKDINEPDITTIYADKIRLFLSKNPTIDFIELLETYDWTYDIQCNLYFFGAYPDENKIYVCYYWEDLWAPENYLEEAFELMAEKISEQIKTELTDVKDILLIINFFDNFPYGNFSSEIVL
ncbi:MAG: hypothetical protein ACLFVP_05890 [Candidatus Bathyarchaeia archaeon]